MSNARRSGLFSLDGARLLVVCPHPDDETLATGLLLQEALGRGARVRVVCVTDGENNPIPQWLAERSLDMERWARRRRWEARSALATLGVAQRDVEFWGWPDQKLRHAVGDMMQRLRSVIETFRPTLVVAPSIHDLHDDHVAAGLAAAAACDLDGVELLTYVVHGTMVEDGALVAAVDADSIDRKLAALECHASQLIASRARLEAICLRVEAFRDARADASVRIAPFRGVRRVMHLFLDSFRPASGQALHRSSRGSRLSTRYATSPSSAPSARR